LVIEEDDIAYKVVAVKNEHESLRYAPKIEQFVKMPLLSKPSTVFGGYPRVLQLLLLENCKKG
jgi:hypothetical protein